MVDCSLNMVDYLCGNNGGLYDEFMNDAECSGNYWNFTLFKVLADMFHDFNSSDTPAIKALFTKDGAITTYSTELYETLKGNNNTLLQNKFFNFQFAKGVRGAIREKTYFKNLLKNMFEQKPAEMERAFTIIGWVVYKDGDPPPYGAVDSDGNCQLLTDTQSQFKKVPWPKKKGEDRVAITRNMVYDIGTVAEPMSVDVAIGKDPLSMHVFKCQPGKKPWFASPYLCNTLANFFDPATFVSGPEEGFGKFPLLELIWLGNVKTAYTIDVNPGWTMRLHLCIGVLKQCLQDYFNKVLLPILRRENTAAADEVVVMIDNEQIQRFLLNVYANPNKTMSELHGSAKRGENPDDEPKITFTVTTKEGEQFTFEMEPGANTITAIENYVMQQTRNHDGIPTTLVNTNNFLNTLQEFANDITGSVPANGILEPKVSCFFFAIKGLGDWIQTQYNKGIIPHLVQVNDAAFNIDMDDKKIKGMDDVRSLPNIEMSGNEVKNVVELTVDKFVCGDVLATTSNILDPSSTQLNLIASGLSAPDWLGENLVEVDVPGFNESFKYWILYFPDGRMKKDLWEKADKKLQVFFPDVSLSGIPSPMRDANRQSLIENASTANGERIFTASGDKITVLLPVYGPSFTLEQNPTYIPNNSEPSTLNSLIELMQRNYDLQHMYSETTTKASKITEVLTKQLQLYDSLFSKYENSFKRMIDRAEEGKDYNIWPTLAIKLRLIKTCNNFFIASDIVNMIAPILDFQTLSQKLIGEMKMVVPGYTTTNKGENNMNTALSDLKAKGQELTDRINAIQATLSGGAAMAAKVNEQALAQERLREELRRRAPRRGAAAAGADPDPDKKEKDTIYQINQTVENIGGELSTLLNNIDDAIVEENENNDAVDIKIEDGMDYVMGGGNHSIQSGGGKYNINLLAGYVDHGDYEDGDTVNGATYRNPPVSHKFGDPLKPGSGVKNLEDLKTKINLLFHTTSDKYKIVHVLSPYKNVTQADFTDRGWASENMTFRMIDIADASESAADDYMEINNDYKYDKELDAGLLPPPTPVNISYEVRQGMWDELAALTLNTKDYGSILTWNLLQLNHKYNYFTLINIIINKIIDIEAKIRVAVASEEEEAKSEKKRGAVAESEDEQGKARQKLDMGTAQKGAPPSPAWSEASEASEASIGTMVLGSPDLSQDWSQYLEFEGGTKRKPRRKSRKQKRKRKYTRKKKIAKKRRKTCQRKQRNKARKTCKARKK